ncbi:MAG: hypothetical protein COW67_13150 [Flavobacteriales bacterium CG18_big_fil_WC_8_21_14_2_50_32_9]|nr:MAG: hypothetical protein COW67_13150 [Flavobacteriales bacterium CG18_big_fil_WC_8_21_14_2_50_32_9]
MNKLHNIIWAVEDGIREVKYAYQRVVNGYDERILWDIAEYLNRVLIPVLKKFRENKYGYPNGLTQKAWDKELDIMIKGFEASQRIKDLNPGTRDSYRNDMKIAEKGLSLFAKRYMNLWD